MQRATGKLLTLLFASEIEEPENSGQFAWIYTVPGVKDMGSYSSVHVKLDCVPPLIDDLFVNKANEYLPSPGQPLTPLHSNCH